MGNFIDFILKTARCSYMYLHNFVIKHLNGQDEKKYNALVDIQ